MVTSEMRPSEILLSELVEQVRRGEVETEPYTGDPETRDFWRAVEAQAAPGQPIPEEMEPEEPDSDPPSRFDVCSQCRAIFQRGETCPACGRDPDQR